MTLGELADLVINKIHRYDTQTRNEAKVYLRTRYAMVYDSKPWRDSLKLVSVNLAATQVVILPSNIDRVISCRWNDSLVLRPEQPVTVLDVDPTIFDTVGDPATFSIIAPSGTANPPAGQRIQLKSSNPAASFRVTIHGTFGTASSPQTQNLDCKEVVGTAGTTWTASVQAFDEILSLSKDSTTQDLQVMSFDGLIPLLRLRPEETSLSHQRLHFHSTPVNSTTALILCKMKHNPLINESDSTEITGIDHGLVALAQADMLEAMRQYQKAQSKFSEAQGLISNAADLETHQSAHIIRLIPYDYS